MSGLIVFVIILFNRFDIAEGWPCVSPIRKVYIRLNSEASLQFTADLRNLVAVRQFDVKFHDNSIKALIRYSPGGSSTTDAVNGVSITGDALGNVVVTLPNAKQSNAGIYYMTSAGFSKRCNSLYILGTPTSPILTVRNSPALGDSVSLSCSSTSTTIPSNHSLSMRYNWNVDNIDNPSDTRYSYSANRNTLTISNVEESDNNKTFSCTATEDVSDGYTSVNSDSISFHEIYGPRSLEFSPNETRYALKEYTNLSPVICRATCDPACRFKWTKLGQVLAVSNSSVLDFGILTRSDAGTYKCTACTPGGFSLTKDLAINIFSFGCTSTTAQHKKTGNSVTIQFQARTVNTENAALIVTNQILSHNDSTLFSALYANNVNTFTSVCNGCTFTGNAATGDLSIRLDNLHPSSGGTYKHSVQESSREVLGCVTLYILGVPEKPTLRADNNNVNTGETIKLTCSSKSKTNPRDPSLNLQYEWRVDNAENPTDTRYVYSQSRNTLTINNVGRQDANRRFTCKATEKGLAVTGLTSADSDDYMINVLYGPESSTTTLSPPDTSYSREENSYLGDITCTDDCNQECRYKWTKSEDTVISNTGVLSLGSLSKNDAATYTCTVTDPNTAKSVRKSVTINVLYPTSVTEFSFQDHDITKTVNETEDVRFICAVDSNPASSIKILFDNGLLEDRSNTKRLTYSRRNVACEHTGVYICEGSNSYGQPSRKNVTLIVRCVPRPLQQIQSNTTSKLHDSVTLTFDVIANPEPVPTEYTWHKESGMRWIPLLSNRHMRIFSRGLQTNMTILNVSRLDFGQYRVTVTNTIGSYEQYLFLVEEDEQKQQTFQCVKCEKKTDNSGLIVGLCFGSLSIVLFVYATFITIKLKRITVKKETQSKEEATKQPTYINVAEGETSRNTNDTSEIQADSVHLYTDLVQYTKGDKTTYDVLQKK